MDKYGLIGFPLEHSFSSRFFTSKFEKEHIHAEYLNYEIPEISLFSKIIADNPQLRGLNVTIPYKEQVFLYLDEIDEDAKQIGAVNVIKFDRIGDKTILKGYNTDVIGFQETISPLLNPTLHKKALVLGTGGASKAVLRGLANLGVEPRLVSRTPQDNQLTYQELNKEILAQYTVIVNTTPLGTFPNVDDAADIPYEYLTENHLLYDLVYNPTLTLFLKKGMDQGCAVMNGADMLEIQALAAWKIWNASEK